LTFLVQRGLATPVGAFGMRKGVLIVDWGRSKLIDNMNIVLRKTLVNQVVVRVLVCSVVGLIAIGVAPSVAWASASLIGNEAVASKIQRITVHIENRRFIPHLIRLRVGQPIRLVFKNDDVELHAFVPTDLLAKTNVQVAGNGAPQFDKQGFHRVLIPSQGQAELTFSPKHAGSFPFFCDLPGHVMNGTVVVEE